MYHFINKKERLFLLTKYIPEHVLSYFYLSKRIESLRSPFSEFLFFTQVSTLTEVQKANTFATSANGGALAT